ncbi:hypothetical protein PTKIN_Ptkin06aG0097800 [Pterospermum kingtungense]
MYNTDKIEIKEPAAQFVNNSDLDASKCSAGCFNKKKKLNASSLNIISEEATVQTSIFTADMVILDSSSNPMGKGPDRSKKVKFSFQDEQPANTIAKGLDSVARKQTTDDSHEKADLKVNGCEVQGCYKTTTGESKILNSCLNPEHKGNTQKADKHTTTVVKTISPDALRHATGLNGMENNSDSRLKSEM